MPSPFPGMDPYLEHPAFFPDLHNSMITYLRETVQAKLPEPYYAGTGDRVWVEVSERPIGPDVNVLRGENGSRREKDESGGVATAVATKKSNRVLVHVPHDEYREPFLEIYSRLEDERLVTAIEVVSLTNKKPGAKGRDLYVRKQQEILNSQVHLVEIDLLRGGEHSTAVPLDLAVKAAGAFDYHVCIHHFDNLEDYFVYPIGMKDPLPEIDIPLLPGDGAVAINLQEVFNRCYDTGPYRRRVAYGDLPLEPALLDEQAKWAAGVLQPE